MPIFSTDRNNDTVRWESKRTLRDRVESLADAFVTERIKTIELSHRIYNDTVAWNDLMAGQETLDDQYSELMDSYATVTQNNAKIMARLDHADKVVEWHRQTIANLSGHLEAVRSERDDLEADAVSVKAELHRTYDALRCRTVQRDLLLAGEYSFPDTLEASIDVQSQLLAAARAEIAQCRSDWENEDQIIELETEELARLQGRLIKLAQACQIADAVRAPEGRAGRVGTKVIREIFEWDAE